MWSQFDFKIVLIIVLGLTALASATTNDTTNNNWLGPEFAILQRVYNDCHRKDDFTLCLKQKALAVVSRAITKDVIRVMDGVTLERATEPFNDTLLDSVDAKSLGDMSIMDRKLLFKVDKFFRTHFVKLDLSEEGRGKKDKGKMGKYVAAALLTAMGIAGPLGLKAIAAVAIKALVISKVALTIAGILALKKIFANDHHEESSIQVHADDHNRRSTYLIRPVKTTPTPTDPYRYYYEYSPN